MAGIITLWLLRRMFSSHVDTETWPCGGVELTALHGASKNGRFDRCSGSGSRGLQREEMTSTETGRSGDG